MRSTTNDRATKYLAELLISKNFDKTHLEELIRRAKLDQRDNDGNVAYAFYNKHKEKYESHKKFFPELAFVQNEVSDVARLIGNAIGGDNALSASLKNGSIEYGLEDYVKIHREPHDKPFKMDQLYQVVEISPEKYNVTVKDKEGNQHTDSPWMFSQASHAELMRWINTGVFTV